MFTGDRSGDWLFRALHRAGLASSDRSICRDDGLMLTDTWVTSAVKCAPPQNTPSPSEREACAGYLAREVGALRNLQVVVCLGAVGWAAACTHFGVRPRPKFGHGAQFQVTNGPLLLGSFHPSQHNTFTGRLTEEMFDAVFRRAVHHIASAATPL
jgi:uracil-DNA glycosylase